MFTVISYGIEGAVQMLTYYVHHITTLQEHLRAVTGLQQNTMHWTVEIKMQCLKPFREW